MRIPVIVSLAAIAVLASGCSLVGAGPDPAQSPGVVTEGGPTEGFVPRPSDEPPVRPAPVLEGPTIDGSTHNLTSWSSPTGNIVCAAFRTSSKAPFEVRCDVLEHVWTVPTRPAACEFDWGHGAYLNTKSGLTCVSDSIVGTESVGVEATWWNGEPGSQVLTLPGRRAVTLAYGSNFRFGPLTCSSQLDGMHCTNDETKAGFDISRVAYTLR